MRRSSNLLRRIFTRIDGVKFNGILKPANEGATNVRSTYRVLFVNNPCFLQAGDVIKVDGQFIILMLHPNDGPDATSFKAVYVQQILSWERKFPQIDSVTGVAKDYTDFIPMGPLYANFDLPENVPSGVLTDTKYRFITGQNIEVGDRVDGKVVKTIYDTLGVHLAFAI